MWPHVGFPVCLIPFKRGASRKAKNLLLQAANSFLLERHLCEMKEISSPRYMAYKIVIYGHFFLITKKIIHSLLF